MANCIDREAFKSKYLCCGYLPEMSEAEFDSFPAADVAPVVRCKDCANSEVTDRGKRYCSAPLGTYGAVPVNDNDFCSHWR